MKKTFNLRDEVFKDVIKYGYEKRKSNKSWEIAERKFLYMTPKLSKGFLTLRNSPLYKNAVAFRETYLINQSYKEIMKSFGDEPANLIDVCCCDGAKATDFLKKIGREAQIRYCPLNVSDYLVNLAHKNVKRYGFLNVVDYKPIVDGIDGHEVGKIAKKLKDKKFKRNVILLLGSMLTGYEINDYLFRLSREMSKGDVLVIGNSIRLGERLVEVDKYKQPIFDQWFYGLVQELGLSREDVSYDARFGDVRVEMLYRMSNDKVISHGKRKISLKRGDEIVVAFLYKYYEEEFRKFCKMYFSEVNLFRDEHSEYALVFCRK